MIGPRSKVGQGGVHEPGDRLGALLREWRGLEPQPNFEIAVWRRIRSSATEAREPSLAEYFRQWILPHPAWSTAIAAAVAVVIGGIAGVSTSRVGAPQYSYEPLLHPRTLAGSYLYTTTEGNR